MIKRVLYFGYYLKQTDRKKFFKYFNHVAKTTTISKARLFADIISSSFKYNISITDYFLFGFYNLSEGEREQYAGTGFMYEYQLKMNPKENRKILIDKLIFLREYKDFIRHGFASDAEMAAEPQIAKKLLENPSGKVVLKSSTGQCGRGIEVRSTTDFNPDSLLQRLKEMENDFVEEFVVQHPHLQALSPSALNTIRVITQITNEGTVDIVAARLRISINSPVDNMTAGNVAAFINPVTGIVEGPGVYMDITKPAETNHPITGVPIVGFQLPLWQETIEMVTKAALHNTGNRSVGWDIAITTAGPELIEGNHDWGKSLWQIPVKRGLKADLLKYL